jgi:alkylation response protein AidB-like acyl-CoA dehydrogenase
MSEAAARDAFADPDQGNASMFAPLGMLVVGDDGAMLSGRWSFASNCLHSSFVGVGAFVQGPDGNVEPVPRLVFVPTDELTIENTWDSFGLRGTGSHHVSTDGVTVDLGRSCAFTDQPWAEGTLWRLPLFNVLVPLLVAVPLGIARGALDEIARQVREPRAALRGRLQDDPVSIAEFAVADASLRAARAAVLEAVTEAEAVAARGESVSRVLQARVILSCSHACDVAVETTGVAHRLGGGAAAYADSPLLRALRDVETARQHIAFSHQHRVVVGQALAGLDVVAPPFIV